MFRSKAMYQFHADDEGTSWRVTGLAARLCIELGLHRREMYEMMTDDERDATTLLFWSIYCLDRRWSFGTGMPFALQDSDIDTHLPRPVRGPPSTLVPLLTSLAGWQVTLSDGHDRFLFDWIKSLANRWLGTCFVSSQWKSEKRRSRLARLSGPAMASGFARAAALASVSDDID